MSERFWKLYYIPSVALDKLAFIITVWGTYYHKCQKEKSNNSQGQNCKITLE